MKRILIAVFVFISAATAFCDQRFDAVAWRDVQTYDVPTLNRIADLQIGKIVAVRFEFRSKRLLHIKPSWYEASLWQHNREEKGGFSYIRRVRVAAERLQINRAADNLRPGKEGFRRPLYLRPIDWPLGYASS